MTTLKNKEIKRGEIYWVNLDPAIGSEIKKTRPALVISNNIQNKISSRIIVVPITSNINHIFPFEAKIIVSNKEAKALTDQVKTVDKIRIGNFICTLSKIEINDVDRAIKLSLNLS